MKLINQRLGIIVYWLAWPGLWLMLRWSKRTRVLIQCDDKIVVVRPWLGNGKWSLPGGGAHKGEDMLIAAVREVREETAVQLNARSITRIRDYVYHQNGLSFSCSLFGVELKKPVVLTPQDYEIIAASWIPRSELTARNSNNDVLEALM